MAAGVQTVVSPIGYKKFRLPIYISPFAEVLLSL